MASYEEDDGDTIVDEVLRDSAPSMSNEARISLFKGFSPFPKGFVPFSPKTLSDAKLLFSPTVDVGVLDTLRRVFPAWDMTTQQTMSSFLLGTKKLRCELYNFTTLSTQLKPRDTEACDNCHKVHQRANGTHIQTQSRSSTQPSAPRTKIVSSKTASRKSKAGRKKIVEQLAEEYSDTESLEEFEDCESCPLVGCNQKKRLKVSEFVAYGCQRPDAHPTGTDMMSLLINDFEDHFVEFTKAVHSWQKFWKTNKPKLGEDALNSSTTSTPLTRSHSLSGPVLAYSASTTPIVRSFTRLPGVMMG